MQDDHPDFSKSCEPQLLPAGLPNNEWNLEELGEYARAQHQAIADSEKSVTTGYWRLGLALNLSRKHFGHSQWQKYLEQLGIDRTRASKARAIHRTFNEERDVVGLSVKDAYERRERMHRAEVGGKERREENNPLSQFLRDVCEKADTLVDEAAFTVAADAAALAPVVREAIRRLTTLLDYLECQADDTRGSRLPANK